MKENGRVIGTALVRLRHPFSRVCDSSEHVDQIRVSVYEGQTGQEVALGFTCKQIITHSDIKNGIAVVCGEKLECVEYSYSGEGA
jgi:hypothetical protein